MKNSVTDRIRKTGTGKLMRRHMAQGHMRAKKSSGLKQKNKLGIYIDKLWIKNV